MFRRLVSVALVSALLLTSLANIGSGENVAIAETDSDDMYSGVDATLDNGYPTLQLGDRDGEDSTAYIVMMQNRLIELGYLNDAADGVFGSNTETAISSFQANNGLQATGIADPATQSLLHSEQELVKATETMDSQSVVYRTQKKLGEWGFLASDPDGVAGDKTNKAVQDFKAYLKGYYMLYPTATPEPTATPAPTLSTGFGDAAVVVDELLPSEASDSSITDEILRFVDGELNFEVYRTSVAGGETGDEVLRVQRRLKQLLYLYSADGEFGTATERALLYFQKKNGLNQTGVADEETQRLLFSETAQAAEEYVFLYKLVVDISEQEVYAYQWNGSSYGTCVRTMTCSTGKNDTPTPLGTYQAGGPDGREWYWFKKYNCYAKWGYFIVGGIMFHSVIYSSGKKLRTGTVSDLGHKASHGCIRLTVENAKWITDNCPAGTTVVIQK